MSRRSGKAASRRARQQRRSRSRPASPGPSAARPTAAAPEPALASSAPAPASSVAPASVNTRPFGAAGPIAGTSRLGEAARAEYHYVARDLRNTAILVLVMAALLGVAVAVVNAAGIGPS